MPEFPPLSGFNRKLCLRLIIFSLKLGQIMAIRHALKIITFVVILTSCKKEHTPPPPEAVKKLLLKDIVTTHIPSPYYHFEYNQDSTVSKVNFASGFAMYDFIYSGNMIAEMKNNVVVNHDALDYLYDDTAKLFLIKITSDVGVLSVTYGLLMPENNSPKLNGIIGKVPWVLSLTERLALITILMVI